MNEYIKEKFTYFPCTTYKEYSYPVAAENKDMCECGSSLEDHDITSVYPQPINAFGRLCFESDSYKESTYCQYLRFSNEQQWDELGVLLTEHWKIVPLNTDVVCVCFIGDFTTEIPDRMLEPVEKFLLQLAKTMRLLIYSRGEACHFTNTIGRFIQRVRTKIDNFEENSGQIYFLGVLPWRGAYLLESLVNEGGDVRYGTDSGDLQSASPYLTHVIYMDENKDLSPDDIPLRGMFHTIKAIIRGCSYGSDNESNIQLFDLVMGGWAKHFFDISPMSNSLCVIKGTGRLANIISDALQYMSICEYFSEFEAAKKDEIREKFKEKLNEDLTEKAFDMFSKILFQFSRVCYHDLSSNRDILLTLCDCLANGASNLQALILCIKWNQLEKFEWLLSNQRFYFDESEIKQLIMLELNLNRYEFISKTSDLGRNVVENFTYANMESLYMSTGLNSLLSLLVKKHPVLAPQISSVPKDVFRDRRVINEFIMDVIGLNYFPKCFLDESCTSELESLKKEILPQSVWHIFIWTVLMNRHQLSMEFLKICPRSIEMAIIGRALYIKRASLIPKFDHENIAKCMRSADALENYACAILMGVEEIDRDFALGILDGSMPITMGETVFSTCQRTEMISMCATLPFQDYVDRNWTFGFETNLILLFLTTICPLLLGITNLYTYGSMPLDHQNVSLKEASLCTRIKFFYRSAQEKYLLYFLYIFICVVLISYALLFDLPKGPFGLLEGIAVFAYLFCAIADTCDFIRFIVRNNAEMGRKIMLSSPFAVFNYVTYALNLIYIIARATNSLSYDAIRIMLSTLLSLMYIRILEFLTVFETYGPQIVMIKSMLEEFGKFLIIILIALVPYGICLQSLLFPFMYSFDFENFLDIFETPFYNLFGELNLDDIRGEREGCEPNGIDCPLNNFVTSLMHLIYVGFAMILLMNLLIAAFSGVYTDLSAKASDIWKYRRSLVLVDFMYCSSIPLPFSTILAIYDLIKEIAFKFCRKKSLSTRECAMVPMKDDSDKIKDTSFNPELLPKRNYFENLNIEKYQSVDSIVARTSKLTNIEVNSVDQKLIEALHLSIKSQEEKYKAQFAGAFASKFSSGLANAERARKEEAVSGSVGHSIELLTHFSSELASLVSEM